MKSLVNLASLTLSVLQALWIIVASGEPIQFCKYRFPSAEHDEIDFCMGALMHRNISSNAYDMYLTMTVSRQKDSALGWTAIGPGNIMDGALMIIVYGDPLSQEDPIVSIRTTTIHHQPTLLAQKDMPVGMDLRVIRSSWLPGGNQNDQRLQSTSHVAWVSLVCYSCHLWLGSDISADSTSQPWMWAWNPKQKFEVFSFDAHLDMHKHHAGAGGWGNFYLDMSRSISTARFPPSLPPIRAEVTNLGASDLPMTFSNSALNLIMGPGSSFHGIVLATGFLIVFPAGVIGLRAGGTKAFEYHWMIQISGSFLLLLGFGLGLLKPRKINTGHQWVGIVLASFVGIQGTLGWRHHKSFARLRRRTVASYFHIWLGRVFMVAGWSNVVSGLLLRGYKQSSPVVIIIGMIGLLQAIGMIWWVAWMRRAQTKYDLQPALADSDEENFALSASDDEHEKDETDYLQPRDSISSEK